MRRLRGLNDMKLRQPAGQCGDKTCLKETGREAEYNENPLYALVCPINSKRLWVTLTTFVPAPFDHARETSRYSLILYMSIFGLSNTWREKKREAWWRQKPGNKRPTPSSHTKRTQLDARSEMRGGPALGEDIHVPYDTLGGSWEWNREGFRVTHRWDLRPESSNCLTAFSARIPRRTFDETCRGSQAFFRHRPGPKNGSGALFADMFQRDKWSQPGVICLTSTRRDEVTSFVYVLVPARSLEYGDLAHLPRVTTDRGCCKSEVPSIALLKPIATPLNAGPIGFSSTGDFRLALLDGVFFLQWRLE
ncbi:hypothetical protein FA13DRAFT_1712014 [Coprinellus micaceus]|uniref:Uncharacterized protein n=1 Tax=Coprinellus micaceus TaxID=71717 RepID=A0A4Y7T2G7_COPMI|nr:hypothetical protein FA13DRAFT_1712014 [Coprinellus micaceus]